MTTIFVDDIAKNVSLKYIFICNLAVVDIPVTAQLYLSILINEQHHNPPRTIQ